MSGSSISCRPPVFLALMQRRVFYISCNAGAARRSVSSGAGPSKWSLKSPLGNGSTSTQSSQPNSASDEKRAAGSSSANKPAVGLWDRLKHKVESGELRRQAETSAKEWKAWWDKNWAEANAIEPPSAARCRAKMREEDELRRAGKLPHWHDDPSDMSRYGLKAGEMGSTRPRYDSFDGFERQTQAWDHTQAGWESGIQRGIGRVPWDRQPPRP